MKQGFKYLLVFIVMLLAVPAFQYSYRTDPNGHVVRWRQGDMPVTYRIDDTGTPDCANEFSAIQNAYQAWEAASSMNWSYGGTGSYDPATDWGQTDGVNINVWCESSWTVVTGEALGVIAINQTWYSYTPSEAWMTDSDIIYNGENFTWSDNGEVGNMDVQNVTTHETGHALILLDLYDAGDSENTMYGYIVAGETKKQTLEADDIAGARFLYPTPPPTETPTPTPTPSPTARPGGSTEDDFTFTGSTDGWSASTVTGYSLPTTSSSGNAISLYSPNDSIYRFGYWNSPAGGVSYTAGKVYVARCFVRTDQATQDNVPSMRLRWITQGLEANSSNAMTSTPSFSYTPTAVAKEYQSYFYPPSTSAMNIAFDMLDFGLTEGGTLFLDEAIVESFDRPGNIGTGTAVKTYDTVGDFSTWTFNPNFGGGFGNVTSANWGTGSLSLISSKANAANAGFFSSPSPSNDATYDTSARHLYRAAFRLSIGADSDRTSMCGIRMRVQNEDNQMTQTMEVTSLNGGVAMPYAAGTDYELYWATPDLPASPGTAEDGFFSALDILDFNGSEGGQVNLESITIEYF